MPEYRLTRPQSYWGKDVLGATDLSERQGYYVNADSPKEACSKLRKELVEGCVRHVPEILRVPGAFSPEDCRYFDVQALDGSTDRHLGLFRYDDDLGIWMRIVYRVVTFERIEPSLSDCFLSRSAALDEVHKLMQGSPENKYEVEEDEVA